MAQKMIHSCYHPDRHPDHCNHNHNHHDSPLDCAASPHKMYSSTCHDRSWSLILLTKLINSVCSYTIMASVACQVPILVYLLPRIILRLYCFVMRLTCDTMSWLEPIRYLRVLINLHTVMVDSFTLYVRHSK